MNIPEQEAALELACAIVKWAGTKERSYSQAYEELEYLLMSRDDLESSQAAQTTDLISDMMQEIDKQMLIRRYLATNNPALAAREDSRRVLDALYVQAHDLKAAWDSPEQKIDAMVNKGMQAFQEATAKIADYWGSQQPAFEKFQEEILELIKQPDLYASQTQKEILEAIDQREGWKSLVDTLAQVGREIENIDEQAFHIAQTTPLSYKEAKAALKGHPETGPIMSAVSLAFSMSAQEAANIIAELDKAANAPITASTDEPPADSEDVINPDLFDKQAAQVGVDFAKKPLSYRIIDSRGQLLADIDATTPPPAPLDIAAAAKVLREAAVKTLYENEFNRFVYLLEKIEAQSKQ